MLISLVSADLVRHLLTKENRISDIQLVEGMMNRRAPSFISPGRFLDRLQILYNRSELHGHRQEGTCQS